MAGHGHRTDTNVTIIGDARPRAPLALAALADQCVRCGVCLPHCPSYRVGAEEGESPRGRIALLRLAATHPESVTERQRGHLERCLACGTCEAVCPSGVRYGELLSRGRALPVLAPRGSAAKSLRTLLAHPRSMAIALAAASVARSLLGRSLAKRLPARWRAVLDLAHAAPGGGPPVAFTPARGARRGALALFRGCAARSLDVDTHRASAEVLSMLGYDVHAPHDPQCCGALASHAGALTEADQVAHATGEMLSALPVDRVVGTASGCQRRLERDVLGAGRLSATSLLAFLAMDPIFLGAVWRIAPRHAAILVPCSEDAAGRAALAAVLERIQGLRVTWLERQPTCCGAAGSYFLEQPAIAEALRGERVAEIRSLAPDLVLTTNVGCRSQLRAGLLAAGLDLPVLHPVMLLAEAIEEDA